MSAKPMKAYHVGDGTLQWYIAQGDQAAWDFYEQQREEPA